ncbi:MAG: hypothetical protein GEV08_14310 [Acidimicrobiia bacterium]|nr:hypothetical protein [Acidimicrobiia bacterium]
MLKVVYLARRREGVPHDELVRRWREVNVADVAAELHPDRYVVTFFRPHGDGPHAWDGMAVVHFEDEERGRSLTRGLPEAARRNGFADLLGDVVRFEADEHVFFERAAELADQPLKLTFLVAPRPGAPHGELVRHWVDVHGPAVAAPMADIPGARRYVASPAHEPAGPYSGVTELSYASREASAAHAACLVDDGFGRLADNGIFLVGEELVVR